MIQAIKNIKRAITR